LPETMTGGDPTPFRTHLFRVNVSELTGRSASPTGGQIVDASKEEPTETAVAERDIALRQAARDAIARIKSVDGSRLTVEVMEGILLLGGVVGSSVEVSDVERAATSVPGARVIVFQIEVDSPGEASPDPVDLALAVNETLTRASSGVASDDLRVIIENGWLRTEGTVKSSSQHADILRELRRVRGARGLVDRIRVG
jgi:BON domain-containing protein